MAQVFQYFLLFAFLNIVNCSTFGRIVGGDDTTIENHPYQVALFQKGEFMCGGSIIHPNYILTAAHCIHSFPASDFSIRAGSSIVDKGGQYISVKATFEHADYYVNDIAILQLSEKLNFGTKINAIDISDATDIVDIEGVATGWGRLSENGPTPKQLQEVELSIKSSDDCMDYYPDFEPTTMFCASEPGRDTCQGDSGGPFVSTKSGKLIGITSYGNGCGDDPGVYTNVAVYKDFIDEIINQ